MSEKYKPANGTEGDIFMSRWCDGCSKQEDCMIPHITIFIDEDDAEYPQQWIYENDVPICTAFEPN